MNQSVVIAASVILGACANTPHADPIAAAKSAPAIEHAQPSPAASAPPTHGLQELEAMTFGCPMAGLNAAAREAAKVPSQGTYQFSYFDIIHDAHHAFYEVHFKSNYQGEPKLKYCVSMYCQQGWDPRTSEVVVTLMSETRRHDARRTVCGGHSSAVKKHRQR